MFKAIHVCHVSLTIHTPKRKKNPSQLIFQSIIHYTCIVNTVTQNAKKEQYLPWWTVSSNFKFTL